MDIHDNDTPLTDLRLAQRFASDHAGEVHHVPNMGWLVWDGRRFAPDEAEAHRKAKETARALSHEAVDFDGDSARRSKLLRWAQGAESRRGIEAMLHLARSETGIATDLEALDADPLVLNVLNGTVDLGTGQLRRHSRADKITKLAPVEFDPNATSERWENFLARACGNNGRELEAFLARAVGYSLTGDTRDEILLYVHGGTATSKTTFIEAIKAVLGDYCATASFETFVRTRGNRGVPSDVARLAGARMVVCSETNDGRALDAARIKAITGGDKMVARPLYKEWFEFIPQLTLWLVANALARVDAEDDAMWRRIVQVPFIETVPEPERDTELKSKLGEPEVQSAILAWAVRGCLDWQQDGLQLPERVRDYTASYRQEMDPIGRWIDDRCVTGPDESASAGDLYASFLNWAEADGGPTVTKQVFGRTLTAKGFESTSDGRTRGRKGIGLRVARPRGEPQQSTADANDASDTHSHNFSQQHSHEGELDETTSSPSVRQGHEENGQAGEAGRNPFLSRGRRENPRALSDCRHIPR